MTEPTPRKLAKQQHIMESAYQLFSDKGIVPVSIPDIAAASGVGRATVFRYFPSKLDLVVAVSTWKWQEYMHSYSTSVPRETVDGMTGAEWLHFYFDSFVDLFRDHPDILRFNYDFNSYLRHEADASDTDRPFVQTVQALRNRFHDLYERGDKDGTLNTDISEEAMFSSSLHILLAAATRYAVGLVYAPDKVTAPADELVMLEELLLTKFTRTQQ